MPLEKFDIQLKNQHRSYFAGQTVSGRVIIDLTEKPKSIHGIKLKLQGKAKTHWKRTSGRITQHYSDKEVYVNEKVYLLGYLSEDDNSEVVLEVGKKILEFSFILPPSLPSSISHKYGYVKYQLEATIKRSKKSKWSNYTSRLPFTINGILDLNLEAGVESAGQISKEKQICCFCCASGPVGFDFNIIKKGYVPGEGIGFHCHLYNHSNRSLPRVVVALVQTFTFLGRRDPSANSLVCYMSKTVQMSKMQGPKLNAGEETDWIVSSDVSGLTVPSVPPSRLDGCKIIRISYFLKIKMKATLKEFLPIVIGTVPLRHDFSHITSHTPAPPIHSSIESLLLSEYPDLPPPTYEEALNGMGPDDLDSNCSDPPDYGSLDCKSFKPKYVLYRFSSK